ncbi:unnamed protein product [Sphagnum tenellum]
MPDGGYHPPSAKTHRRRQSNHPPGRDQIQPPPIIYPQFIDPRGIHFDTYPGIPSMQHQFAEYGQHFRPPIPPYAGHLLMPAQLPLPPPPPPQQQQHRRPQTPFRQHAGARNKPKRQPYRDPEFFPDYDDESYHKAEAAARERAKARKEKGQNKSTKLPPGFFPPLTNHEMNEIAAAMDAADKNEHRSRSPPLGRSQSPGFSFTEMGDVAQEMLTANEAGAVISHSAKITADRKTVRTVFQIQPPPASPTPAQEDIFDIPLEVNELQCRNLGARPKATQKSQASEVDNITPWTDKVTPILAKREDESYTRSPEWILQAERSIRAARKNIAEAEAAEASFNSPPMQDMHAAKSSHSEQDLQGLRPMTTENNALTIDCGPVIRPLKLKPSDLQALLNPKEDPNALCRNEYCQARMKFREGHTYAECQGWRYLHLAHNINRTFIHRKPDDFGFVHDVFHNEVIRAAMADIKRAATPPMRSPQHDFDTQSIANSAHQTRATIRDEALPSIDNFEQGNLAFNCLKGYTASQVIQLLRNHKANVTQDDDILIIDIIFTVNRLHLLLPMNPEEHDNEVLEWNAADVRTWMHHIVPFQNRVQHPTLAQTRNMLYTQTLTSGLLHEHDPSIIAHYSAMNWALHHSVNLYSMDQSMRTKYLYPVYITPLPQSEYTIWDLPALYALWLRASFYHYAEMSPIEWIPLVFPLFDSRAYPWLTKMQAALTKDSVRADVTQERQQRGEMPSPSMFDSCQARAFAATATAGLRMPPLPTDGEQEIVHAIRRGAENLQNQLDNERTTLQEMTRREERALQGAMYREERDRRISSAMAQSHQNGPAPRDMPHQPLSRSELHYHPFRQRAVQQPGRQQHQSPPPQPPRARAYRNTPWDYSHFGLLAVVLTTFLLAKATAATIHELAEDPNFHQDIRPIFPNAVSAHRATVLVNAETVSVIRHINTDQWDKSLTLQSDIRETHRAICDQYRTMGQTHLAISKQSKYVWFPGGSSMKDLFKICADKQMDMVEVRSIADKRELTTLMHEHGLKGVSSGTKYSTDTYRAHFVSDGKPADAYPYTHYCRNEWDTRFSWWDYHWKTPRFYSTFYYMENDEAQLCVCETKYTNNMPIVCQQKKTAIVEQPKHKSKSDRMEVTYIQCCARNNLLQQEINGLQLSISEFTYTQANHIESKRRVTRALPPITPDMVLKGVQIATTLGTSLYRVITKTKKESELTKLVNKQQLEISALNVSFTDLKADNDKWKVEIPAMQNKIALLQTYADIRNLEDHYLDLYNLASKHLQDSLSSFNSHLEQAQQGITSSGLLSSTELADIRLQFFQQFRSDIITDYTSIQPHILFINDTLHLLFNFPVRNSQKKATLLQFFAIPSYFNNLRFTPKLPATYILITETDSKYAFLDSHQATHCIENPDSCRSTLPLTRASPTLCGLSNFFAQPDMCSYDVSHNLEPFLLALEDFIIFSVAEPTILTVDCVEKGRPGIDYAFNISGKGVIETQLGCTYYHNSDELSSSATHNPHSPNTALSYISPMHQLGIQEVTQQTSGIIEAQQPLAPFTPGISKSAPKRPTFIDSFREGAKITESLPDLENGDGIGTLCAYIFGALGSLLVTFLGFITFCQRCRNAFRCTRSQAYQPNQGPYKYNALTQAMEAQTPRPTYKRNPSPPYTPSAPPSIQIGPLINDPLLTPADAHRALAEANLPPRSPVTLPRSILQKIQPSPTPQKSVQFADEHPSSSQQRQLQPRRSTSSERGGELDFTEEEQVEMERQAQQARQARRASRSAQTHRKPQ